MTLGSTQPLTEMSNIKVNQSRYRPGVAQRVSGILRLPDFMTTAQGGGKFVSHAHRPHLLQEILLVLINRNEYQEDFMGVNAAGA